MNALPFSDTKFFLSKLIDHGEKESKTYDLVLEKLQRAKDEWNKERMKSIDFTNKRLLERIEARWMRQCSSSIKYLQVE